MRKIVKGQEPDELSTWKRANPNRRYEHTTGIVKQAIRHACIDEQFGLCAYCCKPITPNSDSSHNEHVEAQHIAPNRTVDFGNIVASCETRGQCGKAHGNQSLPLTPLMDECETEFKFKYSGKIEGKTPRANTSIDVLKLNNQALKEARRVAIEALLYEFGCPPNETADLEADTICILLDDLAPREGCNLKPYSPVLTNILQHELRILQAMCD